jgi:hypothetical protein
MTTHTTTEAAKLAGVTTATIREWIRIGAVVATKTSGKWAITADSLTARIQIGRDIAVERIARNAARIDYTPYKDQAKARDNVYNLIADGSIIPLIPGCYLVVSKTTDHLTYIVNTDDQACDCKGQANWGRCSHLTAANAIEAHRGNTRPRLALAA